MSRPLIGHSAELPPSLLGNPNVLDPDGRLPYVPSGFTTVLEEPGRRIPAQGSPVNAMAFNFAIARHNVDGDPVIYVKTGAGQYALDLPHAEALAAILTGVLTSDQRFAVLYGLAKAHSIGCAAGESEVINAHLEGRLKKGRIQGRPYAWVAPVTSKVAA